MRASAERESCMDDDIAGEPSYPVGMAYSRAGREMTGQYRRPAQYRMDRK